MSLANSLAILKQIFNALPSATKPSLIRGNSQKWRDDFGGSALSSDWQATVGTGQSVNVSNSELKVSTGVTANAQTIIKCKKLINIPCRVMFAYYLSQRIANQEFYLEIVDSSGGHYARWLLNGTSSGFAIPATANAGFLGNQSTVSIVNSGTYAILEIDLALEESKFFYRNLDATSTRFGNFTKTKRIPDPNLDYFIQIRAVNLSVTPSSSTNLFLDHVFFQSLEVLTTEISGGRGSAASNEGIAVTQSSGSTFNITGTITAQTTDITAYITQTVIPLASGASFIGSGYDSSNKTNLTVTVQTDQPGNLYIDQSMDGAIFLDYGAKPCVAGVNTFSIKTGLRYYKIRYINGSTAQGILRIYTNNYAIS